MAKPLTITMPHSLEKPEAIRRLVRGLERLKEKHGDKLTSLEDHWAGDRMEFRAGAFGQTVTGQLDVADDVVRLEIRLPWALAVFSGPLAGFFQTHGTKALQNPRVT